MKQTIDDAFAAFDKSLNLNPRQREQAEQRHNAIRTVLDEAGFVETSFLQGSFARKTMLAPLKDVDIVIVIKAAHWHELQGPNGPATAMSWFKNAVQSHWPSAQFDQGDAPSGKALRVTFAELDFDIDLVPAFDLDGGPDVVIGDRGRRRWEESNTRRQIAAVSTRNKGTGGRFVHQVRELKALIRNHEDQLGFIKGIVVESLAYAAITKGKADKHAIAAALSHAQSAVFGPILEPAGDDDVTVKWTASDRATAGTMFADFAARATEAIELEVQGDVEAAKDAWHSLIGAAFPPASARAPETVLATWNSPGTRTSTGRPSLSQGGREATTPGRAWAPR